MTGARSWIPHGDSEARCGERPGAPANGGAVIKYVPGGQWDHDANLLSDAALRRDDLCETPGFPDCCGESAGLSVDRIDGLSDEDIAERIIQFFVQKPAKPECGAIANIEQLRSIRLHGRAEEQVVFVYDDPARENERHVVIRLKPSAKPRPPIQFLRDEIKKHFKRFG